MAMYFRCKNCGDEHRSRTVQTGHSDQLALLDYVDVQEQCPRTGSVAAYSKPDIRWRDEGEAKAGRIP